MDLERGAVAAPRSLCPGTGVVSPETCITMAAPAKVNLYLGVGSVRADGYHNVETVMHALALADTVVLRSARVLSLAGGEALGVAAEQNLAYRAAEALARRLDRDPGVHITLDKRIPAGAGLGGASSDAAAVLAGLPLLWGVDVEHGVLTDIAAGLGADVPFFLTGGTSLLAGRGDVFVRHVPSPRLEIALIKPDAPVPTAEAYAAFDRLGGPEPSGPANTITACESHDPARVGRALFNNMTLPATELVPEIADVLAVCDADPGVIGSALSGSGSAVFAVCASCEDAARLAAHAAGLGYWSCSTRSSDAGVHLVAEECA